MAGIITGTKWKIGGREKEKKKTTSVVGAEGGEFLINQAFVLRYSTQNIFSSFFGPLKAALPWLWPYRVWQRRKGCCLYR